MCLLDTADGALMLALYIQSAENYLLSKDNSPSSTDPLTGEGEGDGIQTSQNHRDPVAFLYYSIVLTTMTVIVAIVIGVIQLLSLVLNVAEPTCKFWDGVQTASDYYDVIGGAICGLFLIIGVLSVLVYKPWRRWVAKKHGSDAVGDEEGYRDDVLGVGNDNNDAISNERGSSNAQSGGQQVVGKFLCPQLADLEGKSCLAHTYMMGLAMSS